MAVRNPVEIYGQNTDGWTSGSGYPLAARLVLTAAHVVAPAGPPLTTVQVRDRDGELRAARVAWRNPGLDVALVEVTDPHWPEPRWKVPVRWGRLVTQHAGPLCDVRGFPAVVASPEMRDRLDTTGLIRPGSRAKAGLLALDVDNPPAAMDGGSRWAGMSGAAVIEAGFIVGVAVQDPAGFASRQLVAVPITRVLTDPEFCAVVEQHCGHTPTAEPVELAGLAERVGAPTTPAGLLRAAAAITTFRHRPELDELLDWCAADDWFSIRLVHGPGGQGKTRLGRHLIHRLSATGWAGVMLGEHADRDQITGLAHLRTPTLVVVDYAEGRATQLEAVLDALGDADTTTRLLLLARTAGDWRTDRVGTAPILEALADHRIVLPLHPLEPEIDGRRAAWREAVEALTRTLPTVQPADWVGLAAKLSAPPLDGDRYRTILAVQMDALARLLEAAEPLAGPGMTSEDVVLLHERRYWTRIAEQFQVTLDPATLEALILTATLWGATDPDEADTLLAQVMRDTDHDLRIRVDSWLHTLYGDEERHWMGLQPDRLAEYLVGTTLAEPTRHRKLIAATAPGASPNQLEQGLTVLGRAAAHHSTLTTTTTIVDVFNACGKSAVVEALTIATRLEQPQHLLQAVKSFSASKDLETVQAIYAALPPSSLVLSGIRKWISCTIVDYMRKRVGCNRESYLPDLARALGDFAVDCAAHGRRTESLTAAEESLGLYRELVQLNRDVYLPDLARSLGNLSVRLAEGGHRTEAVSAAQEAVALRRELVKLDRAGYLPELAISINNLSVRLAATGRRTEGLAVAQEAVDLRRELVELNCDAHLPDLARSLSTVSVRLADAEYWSEALSAAHEAVNLRRELVELNRDAHLPDLALSLNNLADRLADAGRHSEGLATAREAVDLRRGLVELTRDAHLPDLARSLGTLSVRLAETGRRAEALATAQEAVALRRELVELNHDAHQPDLAMSINNLSVRLAAAGRPAEALATAQEAVAMRRGLAAHNRDAHLPDLARSLDTLSVRLAEAGRRTEAVAVVQEAVKLYRELAASEPDRFAKRLAESRVLLKRFADEDS